MNELEVDLEKEGDKTIVLPMSDEDLIPVFDLANEPSVRTASFNQNEIELEGHRKWFKNKLQDNNAVMLKSVTAEKLTGQVRLDIEGDKAVIGISVSEKFRGRGIGSELLQAAIKEAQKRGIKEIEAFIKPDNSSSIALFEKNGWVFSNETEVSGVKAKKYIYIVKEENGGL
jgi:UDP-2,4-diacetamido-2,4,6-trideoxy-beta-L-altropyranose hydrolase